MPAGRKFVLAASLGLLVAPALTAFAAAAEDKEKDKVLRKLDAAAANFHSTSADFQFDSVQTEPIPDKDVQTGTVFYERKGTAFKMAAHIRELNGKPSPKVYSFAGGVFKLYEQMTDQVTTFSKAGQFESYVMLGFGASGKDLEQKWEVKYQGEETLEGVKTAKLELVAKDPAVRKNIPKVVVWLDAERAVSLKQLFDEGPGQYRVCTYRNIKVNQALPAEAFTFKTDSKTQFVER